MRRRAVVTAAFALFPGLSAFAQRSVDLPPVEVVGITPLPGIGNPLPQVPSNVQTFGEREIARQRLPGIAGFLEQNAGSVNASAPSGNPYQPDLSFRGFTASPLLGTPQGLSVFLDGVRENDPFGDAVHWDTIPLNALATVQVVPGSNALYGLNTLGGALVMTTKSGARNAGAVVDVNGGSFGRFQVEAEAGGVHGPVDGYVAANVFDDDGWRDHSSTRIRQLFAKGGWGDGGTDLNVSVNLADNRINGTQALPLPMLDDPKQAYTWPDSTHNRLESLSARFNHAFSANTQIVAAAYARRYRSDSVNSNVNADLDEPDAPPAFNVASNVDTRSSGAAAQFAWRVAGAWGKHQLVAGASYDRSRTGFTQSEQPATFTDDRDTVGTGPYALQTDVVTTTSTSAAWLADTAEVAPGLALSGSIRYNVARVSIADQTGLQPELDGAHRYSKWLPAAGIAWSPSPAWTLFGNLSQGMRVPTPMELTCADPEAPCTLPNIFVADPPLAAVIATTGEIGARGRFDAGAWRDVTWSTALFRTDTSDDIQFIGAGSGAVNAGYFRNVGKTRRQGFELFGGARIDTFTFSARYTLLDATFQTGFVESSPNNSTADADGDIDVSAGNRLPGVPRHTLKFRVDWNPQAAFSIGASVVAQSAQYARGDENNADVHGTVPGFAVVNLDARWRFAPGWELYGRIENVFNRRYQNFGILGSNYFAGPDNSYDPAAAAPDQFRGPGAPIGAWLGVRWTLDRTGA